MTDRPRVAHYLRHNEQVKIPRRHVIFDTETFRSPTDSGHHQTWRLGAAAYVALEPEKDAGRALVPYGSPEALWEHVSAYAKPDRRTVVWAHNLAFDLRVSRALELLPALGWELKAINLMGRGSWARWKKHRRSLVMIDTGTIWPCALDNLASDLDLPKLPLPAWGSSSEAWIDRCVRDVEVLTEAVLSYLSWIKEDDLGNMQVTGPGQAMSAFRHRWLSHHLLVHTEQDALDAERRAAWSGRAEAFFIGRKPNNRVFEFDLSNAYPRLAESLKLPTKLVGEEPGFDHEDYQRKRERFAILADVTVTTEAPVVPTADAGRIVWPVGTFKTTLWDVEIDLALEAGATVTFERAWTYTRQPVLKEWAAWIFEQLARPDSELPPHLKRIVKHWSRALIGRFALRLQQWEPFATAPDDELSITQGYDMDELEPFTLLQVGEKVMRLSGSSEAESSLPQITSYVTAAARARLWRIMQAVGEQNLIYVDTDSVIVGAKGRRIIESLDGTLLTTGLRLKSAYLGIEVLGARKIVTGKQVKIAGIPKNAERMGNGEFTGEVWESLRTGLKKGRHDRVNVNDRKWKVMTGDRRRVLGPGGRTFPVRLGGVET